MCHGVTWPMKARAEVLGEPVSSVLSFEESCICSLLLPEGYWWLSGSAAINNPLEDPVQPKQTNKKKKKIVTENSNWFLFLTVM